VTEDSHSAPVRLIFCCPGASNVGVLSFQAAIRLAKEESGVFSCIAGIGSRNPPMIHAAKSAGERVVIDGCPVGCARSIVDANLIPIDRYVVVTEPGVGKTHTFDVEALDLQTVVEEVKRHRQGTFPVTTRGDNRLIKREDGE